MWIVWNTLPLSLFRLLSNTQPILNIKSSLFFTHNLDLIRNVEKPWFLKFGYFFT